MPKKFKRKILALLLANNQGGVLHPFQTASFYAPLTHSLVLTRGTGSPTYTRATTAYVTDFEGLLKQVPSGAARFSGARVVRNLISSPETIIAGTLPWHLGANMSSATGATDPVGGSSAITLTATGANATLKTVRGSTDASTDVPSLWIKRKTGTGAIRIFLSNNTSQVVTSAVTSSWQRISGAATASSATDHWFGVGIDVSGDEVYIWHPQLESVTGQSNQNPSEYVSVGVLSAPYHGAGVDGVKFFNTQNGNTVASNVVTEATGAAIPAATTLGFLSEGARTNRCLHSQDIQTGVAAGAWVPSVIAGDVITNGAFAADTDWTKVGTATISGGVANLVAASDSVRQLTLTAPAGSLYKITFTGVRTSGSLTVYCGTNSSSDARFAKSYSASGTYTVYLVKGSVDNRIQFSVGSGGSWTVDDVSAELCAVATTSGITAPDGTATAHTLTAGAANATLIQDLGVVASAAKAGGLWLKRKTGTGNIDLTLDGGSTWTTKAITSSWARYEITQTLADEDFGIRIVTSGDEVYAWQGQVETPAANTTGLSSDIVTTTIAVARSADLLSYQLAGNIDGTVGTCYVESMFGSDSQARFIDSAGGFPIARSGVHLIAYDGASRTLYANSLPATGGAASVYKLASRWSGAVFKGSVNGVNGVDTTFDGDLGLATNLKIGGQASVEIYGTIKNVRVWTSALTDAQLQTITS